MNTMLTRRGLGTIFVSSILPGETPRQTELYAVTASPQPFTDLKFPAVLFNIGSKGNTDRWAAELVRGNDAADYVLYSYEGRVCISAGPKAVGNVVTIVHFDSPGHPIVARLDLDGMAVVGRHLVWSDRELNLAVHLRQGSRERFLTVRLADGSVKRGYPDEMYRAVAIDGSPGGLILNNDFAYLEEHAYTHRLYVVEARPGVGLSVVLPKERAFGPKDVILLAAINSRLVAVTSRETSSWRGQNGFSLVQVQDRLKGSWETVRIPGGPSSLRAFGEWLVAHVRYELAPRHPSGEVVVEDLSFVMTPSPGREHRRQRDSNTGCTFDALARFRRVYQPGTIFLYHVPTKRTVTHETAQGDSEVLWIETDSLIYRSADVLYQAQLTGEGIGQPRELMRKDFIADVHWLFNGPASSAPADPPWKSFISDER